jgi:hypothetical protein
MRQLTRGLSDAHRAKLAAVARAERVQRAERERRGEGPVWTPQLQERIRKAYSTDGQRGAMAAFPEMRPMQVLGAIRRYCLGGEVAGPPVKPLPKSHPEIRARWDALFREMAFAREAIC